MLKQFALAALAALVATNGFTGVATAGFTVRIGLNEPVAQPPALLPEPDAGTGNAGGGTTAPSTPGPSGGSNGGGTVIGGGGNTGGSPGSGSGGSSTIGGTLPGGSTGGVTIPSGGSTGGGTGCVSGTGATVNGAAVQVRCNGNVFVDNAQFDGLGPSRYVLASPKDLREVQYPSFCDPDRGQAGPGRITCQSDAPPAQLALQASPDFNGPLDLNGQLFALAALTEAIAERQVPRRNGEGTVTGLLVQSADSRSVELLVTF